MNYETMTNEQLRIAVAERLGWSTVSGGLGYPSRRKAGTDIPIPLPGFPSDLNACHEMESDIRLKISHHAEGLRYLEELKKTTGVSVAPIFATARQRCLAFLKATEGKKE